MFWEVGFQGWMGVKVAESLGVSIMIPSFCNFHLARTSALAGVQELARGGGGGAWAHA